MIFAFREQRIIEFDLNLIKKWFDNFSPTIELRSRRYLFMVRINQSKWNSMNRGFQTVLGTASTSIEYSSIAESSNYIPPSNSSQMRRFKLHSNVPKFQFLHTAKWQTRGLNQENVFI